MSGPGVLAGAGTLLLGAFVLVAALIAGWPARAEEAVQSGPNADNGRRLAEQWCAECHRVSPRQLTTDRATDAPDFVAIARTYSAGPERLRDRLAEDHLPMPTFRLWESEKDDLAAYIRSLGVPPL
jgi:mono/diheme cytochrome c family protein